MLASLNWLRRYVDIDISVEEVEKALTSLGLEVESVDDQGDAYSDLIVAKVLEREKHPDAEKLSVTKVFDGENELQVVCGAPNVDKGQTVVFAPVGSRLPTEDPAKPFKIKKAKIRGVESLGMICAEDEVGLGDSHNGIMVLDDALEAGTKINSLPGFYDVILEINVTPNRPDALSMIGIARELAGHLGKELKMPEFDLEEDSETIEDKITIEIEEGCGCTKYTGRIIQGVKIGESPEWLKSYLNTVGVASINNVVDATNFVLFETGQPSHAFDLNKLPEKAIVIRNAQDKEKLTTLDHVERELMESDMVICDANTPVCLGGVMGGENTEISAETTDVFLEVAYFNPPTVRKTARRLGLSSDSSYRFERGISPFQQEAVSDYLASLIKELAGGKVLKGRIDCITDDHPKELVEASIRLSRIKKVLGVDVASERVTSLLERIGLKKVKEENETLTFQIPGYRPDLLSEVDLVEEVVQKIGFEEIPMLFPKFELALNELPKKEMVTRKVRDTLAAAGLNETISLKFDSIANLENVFAEGDERRDKFVKIINPLSEDLAVMPTSLLPRYLKSVEYNEKNRETSARFFEVSKSFFSDAENKTDKYPGVIEKEILGGMVAGSWDYQSVSDKPSDISVLDLKGILENLFSQLRLNVVFNRASTQSFFHPNKQFEILLHNKVIGFAGEVHPQVLKNMDVSLTSCYFEVDYSVIIEHALKEKKFKAFSKAGKVTKEISMQVDSTLDHQSILDKVKKVKTKNLVDVNLQSIYEGQGVPEGKKAVLYQFVYQSDKTLNDNEVNKAQENLANKLAEDSEIEYR